MSASARSTVLKRLGNLGRNSLALVGGYSLFVIFKEPGTCFAFA
jgi:hypothetical protein